MKTKIASAKSFVKKHQLVIVATAGVVAGASGVYFSQISGRTLLEVTAANVDHMRANEMAMLYETPKLGAIMVTVPKHP